MGERERVEVSNRLLNTTVIISASSIEGQITMVGIDDGGKNYLIEYANHQGQVSSRWFRAHQLTNEEGL